MGRQLIIYRYIVRKGHWPFVWLEELGWQTFFGYLELSPFMSDVDIVEGMELPYFFQGTYVNDLSMYIE